MRILKWTNATMRSIIHRTATVNLIVTRRCDLACSYCHARQNTPEISHDDWIRIVDILSKKFSVFTVSGGEPLLYSNLPSLINRISRRGIAALCTNCRILDQNHLEEMTGLDYLNFSIDHTGGSDVSDKTAYGKLSLMSEYASRNSFELQGTAVITARNIEAIPTVIKELATYRIPANLQLVQRVENEDAFDSPDKIAQLKQLSAELIKMKQGGYPIWESDAYIDGFADFVENKQAVRCLAGKAYLAVDSDGHLMACQDIKPSDISLRDRDDLEQALKRLTDSIPLGCRCWWNCYHQYARWYNNPASFLISSLMERLRSNRAPARTPGS